MRNNQGTNHWMDIVATLTKLHNLQKATHRSVMGTICLDNSHANSKRVAVMKIQKLLNIGMLALFLATGVVGNQVVSAADVDSVAESDSYQVHLGIVPARAMKKHPQLVDGDRTLHGGIGNQGASSQHIMVAIFHKDDHSRVKNATVIAELKQGKLLSGWKQIKPLEKMLTSGAVTYGNFFPITESGRYSIEVDIYVSDRSGAEFVAFEHEFH